MVIGASSGLGNTCAKILALGGAKVLATYHTKNIQEDIPNCDFLQYNVLKPSKISIEKIKNLIQLIFIILQRQNFNTKQQT